MGLFSPCLKSENFSLLKVVDNNYGCTPWPRVWLLGVLDTKMAAEVDPLHPDQWSESWNLLLFLRGYCLFLPQTEMPP